MYPLSGFVAQLNINEEKALAQERINARLARRRQVVVAMVQNLAMLSLGAVGFLALEAYAPNAKGVGVVGSLQALPAYMWVGTIAGVLILWALIMWMEYKMGIFKLRQWGRRLDHSRFQTDMGALMRKYPDIIVPNYRTLYVADYLHLQERIANRR